MAHKGRADSVACVVCLSVCLSIPQTSEPLPQPITSCDFNSTGTLFAYAVSYDWSKGHEHHNPQRKSAVYFRQAQEDLKPRPKKGR